jgi:hypothetical protein
MADWRDRIVGFERIPANQLLAHPNNARRHPAKQREALRGSLDTLGWYDAVIYNRTTGYLVDGHARVEEALTRNDEMPLPVLVVELDEHEEAQALASHDFISYMAEYDRDTLSTLLHDVASDDERIQSTLSELAELEGVVFGEDNDFEVDMSAKPNPRNLPIDLIYTIQGADATCCLAVRAGLKYGIQSPSSSICPYCSRGDEAHAVAFIDNDYFHYDHAAHLKMVSEHRPKYCTVMDVITDAQARRDGVDKAYSLQQILEWADELSQYAEHVIVIPKYDCLDKIPEHFVLGYSVPTSHGGTPLPPEAFKGRRVHLLGGSWKAQLAHMAVLRDDVVSVDNNHVHNIARQWGQYVLPNGETRQLQESDLGHLNNPRYAALALSFGAMAAKVNELYAVVEPAT